MTEITSSPTDQPEAVLPSDRLLELLRSGREAAFDVHSQALMRRLAHAFAVSVTAGKTCGRMRFCSFSHLPLRVRGFGKADLLAIIVAEPDSTWMASDSRFWTRVENPLDLPFIFTCGEQEYALAKARVGGRFTLVWHPEEIVALLRSEQPMDYVKQLLRRRFGVGELHPFDHHHPVVDAAFVGRHHLLQRLRDNPRTNFALVGPTGMGKTSLIKRYLQPDERGPSRRDRLCYLDLYPVPATEGALARALRMSVDASAAAFYDTPENFVGFLEKARSRLGRPLEIVLDEVDKHCGLDVMRQLIHLAQKEVCRLILIGRWRLMKEAVHTHDDNFSRLETIVVQALSADEAAELVEKPLDHLGLHPRNVRHELRAATARLGYVPGQLQEFGCLLIEELAHTRGELTTETIRLALARSITSSRLIGLLDDLSCGEARIAALLIAFEAPFSKRLDPVWLQMAMRAHGIRRSVRDCIENCNELVIHHLLIYDEGDYRVCRWDFIAEGKAERRTFVALLDEEIELLA